jgi:hypothetical protein
VEYVEQHTGEPVDLSRIDVTAQREAIPEDPENNVRNDGIIELAYSQNSDFIQGVPNPVFYGKIHGPAQVLFLRHGWGTRSGQELQDSDMHWANDLENLPTPIQGACATVRNLGGEFEAKADCHDSPKAKFLTDNVVNVLLTDTFLTVCKTGMARKFGKFPLTRLTVSNLTPTGEQFFSTGSRMKGSIPSVLVGATGYYGSLFLLDNAIGWDPQWHHHERSAVGSLGGYAAYRGMDYFVRPSKLLSSMGGARSSVQLTPMSFGSGLLSAALVDALMGESFQEGSAARDALRTAGFFLPAIYRGMMGSRTLPLVTKYPMLAQAGRIATTTATIGFVADLGIMGYHHLTEDEAEITRDNRLYQRAGEIAKVRESWFSKLWRGALGMIVPAFMEHQVSQEYVEEARRELADNANGLAEGAAQVLRHQLIFGNSGEENHLEFYQKVDWELLRGENKLGVIKKDSGKGDWYLNTVASDLADPQIRYEYLENKSVAQQIRFIQGRYRWDLSEGDVQDILSRIALYHAREDLAQIHSFVSRGENPWAQIFDEAGKLNTGQETNLLIHLFASTGEVPTEEQLLALRKVGLLVRIRQLRQSYKEKKSASEEAWTDPVLRPIRDELRNVEALAKQLRLMGENGKFMTGEIGEQAMRISVAPAATNRPMLPPGSNVIKTVLRENASGLL